MMIHDKGIKEKERKNQNQSLITSSQTRSLPFLQKNTSFTLHSRSFAPLVCCIFLHFGLEHNVQKSAHFSLLFFC